MIADKPRDHPLTKILFVDDERNLLDGLKRSLHAMRTEWEMSFASSGEEALELMLRQPPHVIVSDMRMPGMTGRDLLAEVKQRYPQVIRFVLSGYADAQSVMQIVGTAHQYLAKPCDSTTIKRALARAAATRKMLSSQSLIQRIGRVSTLPSLPATYQEIVACLEGPDPDLSEIALIIGADLAMTTVLLKVANSAYFGARQTFKTVDRAVSFLGLQTISGLVLAHGLFAQTTPEQRSAVNVTELWDHSLRVGIGARAIARFENWSSQRTEEVYLTGVIHDLGRLVLSTDMDAAPPEHRGAANSQPNADDLHAGAGAYLLSLWGFGDELVEAIACHHDPLNASATEFGLAGLIHVADVLSRFNDAGVGSTAQPQFQIGYLEQMGMVERVPQWQETWRRIAA